MKHFINMMQTIDELINKIYSTQQYMIIKSKSKKHNYLQTLEYNYTGRRQI